MSIYTVRPAIASDVKAIAALHISSTQAACEGIVPKPDLDRLAVGKSLELWREAIEFGEPQVQVAVDGDRPVGFVGYDRSRDPKTKATVGEIWALYVQPGDWDQGAGLALWDAARDGLVEEGCTDVTVWVMLRNERVLRFFELAGFKREMNTARTRPMGSVKVEEIRLKRRLA